jgi:hypothetical protein
MKEAYQPIEIHIKNPINLFNEHRLEISKAIVNGIEYGMSNRKQKIDFAKVIVKDLIVITLSIKKKEFSGLLDEHLKILVEYEEYESCALIMKLKEKLNKKNEKVTKKNRILD